VKPVTSQVACQPPFCCHVGPRRSQPFWPLSRSPRDDCGMPHILAAMNNYLAKSNKSCTGVKRLRS
jgi:hypothetical protein